MFFVCYINTFVYNNFDEKTYYWLNNNLVKTKMFDYHMTDVFKTNTKFLLHKIIIMLC